MQEFFLGWGFTAAALGLITLVFFVAHARLGAELRYVRDLTDYLGYDLVAEGGNRQKPPATLRVDEIRDQVNQVAEASDPVWALKQVRGWQMRAQRLEPALAFWVDLLRQLGLLGTVVGLGFSMLIERSDVTRLLGPLGLAVWTTVFGLAYSIWLSARYSGKMAAWADACEKNIEAWEARARRRQGGRTAP
jgi:MotA/TolQ/ExbB proton channel family